MIQKKYYIKPQGRPFKDDLERQEAYRNLFQESRQGQKVLFDILLTGGFFDNPRASDARDTEYNLGRQHTCRDIINLLQIELLEDEYD